MPEDAWFCRVPEMAAGGKVVKKNPDKKKPTTAAVLTAEEK